MKKSTTVKPAGSMRSRSNYQLDHKRHKRRFYVPFVSTSSLIQRWLGGRSGREPKVLGNRLFRLGAHEAIDQFAVFED
jgi:hypothetical protein